MGARVAHVHGHRVAAVLREDGGEALVDRPRSASSQVASAKLPSALLDQRRAQPVRVLVQVLQAGGLGADEAVAEHVLGVAAHRHDVAAARPSPRGRRWPRRRDRCGNGSTWRRPRAEPTPRRSSIQSARERASTAPPASSRTQAASRLRPSWPAAPRHEHVRLAGAHGPSSDAASRRQHDRRALARSWRTGALVGQSSAAQTHSGRTAPDSSASDSCGVQSAAKRGSRPARRGRSRIRRSGRARAADEAAWGTGARRSSRDEPGAPPPGRPRPGSPGRRGPPARSARTPCATTVSPSRTHGLVAVDLHLHRALERRRRAQRHLRRAVRRAGRPPGRTCSRRWPSPAGR